MCCLARSFCLTYFCPLLEKQEGREQNAENPFAIESVGSGAKRSSFPSHGFANCEVRSDITRRPGAAGLPPPPRFVDAGIRAI